jgi:hypothetical protein
VIKTDIVFLLGAGASRPFGFPTGAELRRRICSDLSRGQSPFARLCECGHSDEDIERFRASFEQSGIASIDAFIAFRPEFQTIGEHVIAAMLIPIESSANLAKGDWYHLLWNEMLAGASTPEDLLRNKVRFVTFNYDRSLEQYLYDAILHTFGLAPRVAFSYLLQIPIQHVYGSLGEYTEESGYRYSLLKDEDHKRSILAAQTSIKTVPLVRGPTDDISAKWLADAERVFVLGFGFDSTNCARIGLRDACSATADRHTRPIFASAYQLTQAEKWRCDTNSSRQGPGLQWTNGDCLTLLRDKLDMLLS